MVNWDRCVSNLVGVYDGLSVESALMVEESLGVLLVDDAFTAEDD